MTSEEWTFIRSKYVQDLDPKGLTTSKTGPSFGLDMFKTWTPLLQSTNEDWTFIWSRYVQDLDPLAPVASEDLTVIWSRCVQDLDPLAPADK